MKADTVPSRSAPVVVANAPSEYLKPVLTPANPSGLPPPPPQGPPGGGPHPPGPELALAVECGPNKAWFYVGRLCQGSKGPCVLFNGAWLTPNEFQYVSGRETAKDWKRSIRHHGKSMKLLMTKGILAISPPSCQCDVCTGCAENNNNLDVNKRAAEIAARKAAVEAAALAEAAGKIASTENETSCSGMAEGGAVAATDERQCDPEGGSDQNSPAKESRLTNIIEAIKSKKKKDPSDPGDTFVQKENRPNSRPSSRTGKTKKSKDSPSENGIGSPVHMSPPHVISGLEHAHHAILPVPVSLIGNPLPMLPNSVIDIVPQSVAESSHPLSSPSSSSISSSSSPGSTISPPTDVSKPTAPLSTVLMTMSASSPTKFASSDAHNLEGSSSTAENADSDDDSDIEPCEVVPEDVSRTRAFDWTAWKQKKISSEHNTSLNGGSSIPGSIEDKYRTENNNSYKVSDPHIHGQSHDDEGHIGDRSKVSNFTMNHHWTPSIQVSQSVPPVTVGQDTKPPLLSATRSITTATASITKPIVSIGTGAFSATIPKEQREPGRDGKEESSKVYAPINWPPVATEVGTKEAKLSVNDSPSRNSDMRNGVDARTSEGKTHTVSASQSSPEKDRARNTPSTSSASEEHKRLSEEQKRLPSPSRKEPPRPDVPVSSNYSEYLRQLGRVPAVPPPGVDDESYVALMRRYYEWYELARLYGPYGMPPGAQPGTPAAPSLQRPPMPHPAAGPYDPHTLLTSMYHPYYYPHAAAAGDPYRSLGTVIPPEWARLGQLSEHEREALIARQREQEKEAGGSPHGLKRGYPGDEALDLSVNKKQKLAESLAARDGALLYGLQAGFRQPHLAMMGLQPGAGYPQGLGSLELAAAAYPGLWGMPHSHPGASLSHPLQNAAAGIPHPGMQFQHPLSAVSRSQTSNTVTASGSPHNHKDLLQAGHNPSQALGLAGAWR